jgi:hypothetical protein
VSALALQSKSDTPTIISLAGNMVLYEICNLIGAMTIAPYKFMWWVAGLIFLGLVFMVLMQRLNNPEGYGGPNLQVRLRLPRVQEQMLEYLPPSQFQREFVICNFYWTFLAQGAGW